MSPLSPANSERRRHARLELAVPVKISSGDFDIVTETKNISRSGILFKVGKHLAPMTKLKMHLLLPLRQGAKVSAKRIDCEGVVIRCEESPQEGFLAAIFFNTIKPRDSAAIGRFVDSKIDSLTNLLHDHRDGHNNDSDNR